MKSWSGLYGAEDKRIREKGNEYVVADLVDEGLVILDSVEDLEDKNWIEWVNVVAENPENAMEMYDEAYYQFRAWNEDELKYPPHEHHGEPPEYVKNLKN